MDNQIVTQVMDVMKKATSDKELGSKLSKAGSLEEVFNLVKGLLNGIGLDDFLNAAKLIKDLPGGFDIMDLVKGGAGDGGSDGILSKLGGIVKKIF